VGFYDGQKWRWGRFSPRTSVSPANLHSTCFSTIIFTITRGWDNRPGVAAVPIASQTRIKKKVPPDVPNSDLVPQNKKNIFILNVETFAAVLLMYIETSGLEHLELQSKERFSILNVIILWGRR
jgi:hypothetical protein